MTNKELTLKSRESKWYETIGLIIGVLGIVVGLAAWLIPNSYKDFTFAIKDVKPMLQNGGSIQNSNIKMLVGEELLENPWVVSTRITNSGTSPIESKDVDQPLRIEFPDSKIVLVNTPNKSDPLIDSKITFKDSIATINHGLLNQSDWFEIDFILNNKPSSIPSITSRIVGLKSIRRVDERLDSSKLYPTIYPLPNYLAIPASVLIVIVSILIAMIGLSMLALFFRNATAKRAVENSWIFKNISTPSHIRTESDHGQLLLNVMGKSFTPRYSEDIQLIAERIKSSSEEKLLSALGETADTTARIFHEETRKSYKNHLKYAAQKNLKEKCITQTLNEIESLFDDNLPLTEINTKIRESFEENLKDRSIPMWRYSVSFFSAISLLALAAYMALLAIGTLRIALAP